MPGAGTRSVESPWLAKKFSYGSRSGIFNFYFIFSHSAHNGCGCIYHFLPYFTLPSSRFRLRMWNLHGLPDHCYSCDSRSGIFNFQFFIHTTIPPTRRASRGDCRVINDTRLRRPDCQRWLVGSSRCGMSPTSLRYDCYRCRNESRHECCLPQSPLPKSHVL